MNDSHSNNSSGLESDSNLSTVEQFKQVHNLMISNSPHWFAQVLPPASQQQSPPEQQVQIMNAPQQMTIKGQEEIEYPENPLFGENNGSIMVTIEKQTQVSKVNGLQNEFQSKTRSKVYILTYFLIRKIIKKVYKECENDRIVFEIECKYFDHAQNAWESLEIEFDEEYLTNHQLVKYIKKEFGSKHTAFPAVNKNIDTDQLLAQYILQKYKEATIEEPIDCYSLNLNDTDNLSDPERKAIVQNFYRVYTDANLQSKLLLTIGFGALCFDELLDLQLNTIPDLNKVFIIYGCQDAVQQELTAAWASVTSDVIEINRLSGIKVTSKQDELHALFFRSRYQTAFFEDDELNDYSRKQNLKKIQRISEHVCNGIFRGNKETIVCSAVIFTRRKLIEFKDIAKECIFINATDLPPAGMEEQDIIANFISLLYNNIDYYFEQQKSELISHLSCTDYSHDMGQIETVYEIYIYLVNAMFETFGIVRDCKDHQTASQTHTDKSTSAVTAVLNQSRLLLTDKANCTQFIQQINRLIQNESVPIRLYDRKLSANDQALLYEHQGEPLLLFSYSYFDSLFPSPVVDNKELIRILHEGGHLLINYLDKQCFRMPKDERKLYTAVKLSALDAETISMLPELHPVIVPDLNDGIARIQLGIDEHGRPIYWPVGKLENRSVLVQGNTRTGKTYFVTTKLLTGLHELGYRIIVFDSEASSYSQYELSKCGYDNAFITEHFYHGQAKIPKEIMKEFMDSLDKIYIVNNSIEANEKVELCKLLFDYQKETFTGNEIDTPPLFVVFEEAGDNIKQQDDIPVYDSNPVKRLYNQGSKLRLSVITILQMFSGEGSQRFRKMVAQSSLKVAFKCSTDNIKYFIETIPHEFRDTAKSKLPMLSVGEAIICGDFEGSDKELHTDGFLANV